MSDGGFFLVLGSIFLALALIEIVEGPPIDKALGGASQAQGRWVPTRWLGVALAFGSLAAIVVGVVLMIR